MKNVPPSYTELQKAQRAALTNPKKDSRARLLLSSGNPEYFLQRAMEELTQAMESLQEADGPNTRKDAFNNAMLLISGAAAIDQRTPL